jgi:uncharacterized protein YggE
MRTTLIVFGLIVLIAARGFAQMPEAPKARPNTVTVRGTGTVSAEPDRIRLSMQVTVRSESASMAMTTASQRTKEVLDLLREHGVEAKDIQTTRVAVSPVYDYEKRTQPPPIIGYTAGNDFTALFRAGSMGRIGEFLDKAVAAGASNFGSLIYESSDERSLEEKALGEAAENARGRADVLAARLGARVGRALSITETGMSVPSPVVQDYIRAESGMAAPVMPGEMNIIARVDVVFELLEP